MFPPAIGANSPQQQNIAEVFDVQRVFDLQVISIPALTSKTFQFEQNIDAITIYTGDSTLTELCLGATYISDSALKFATPGISMEFPYVPEITVMNLETVVAIRVAVVRLRNSHFAIRR